MCFLEEHTKTTKIKDQQMCSFPLPHSLCPRKGLIGKDENQNISYPQRSKFGTQKSKLRFLLLEPHP